MSDALTDIARIIFMHQLRGLHFTEDAKARMWEDVESDPERLALARKDVHGLAVNLRQALADDVTTLRATLAKSAADWRLVPSDYDRGVASGLELAVQKLDMLVGQMAGGEW